MSRPIRLSARYPQPPGAVWHALTDSALLARWLMPNDFRPAVGHRFHFRTKPAPGFDGIVRCEVLEIVEHERLSFSWVGGGIDTVVTFEIAPDGSGTRLEFHQTGFAGLRGTLLSRLLGNGWRAMVLKRLPVVLSRTAGQVTQDQACGAETTPLWRMLNKILGRR